MNHEKFLKYSSALFLILGLFLLLGPRTWFPSFYHPIFFGILFLLFPLLTYLPVIILKKNFSSTKLSLLHIRSRVAFALFLNNAGELGLYKMNEIGFEYDKFAHFLVSMLFAYTLGEYLSEKYHFRFPIFVFTVITTVFLSGILWEIFEAASDMLFETKEWGIYGKSVFEDTWRDILFNTLGILAALIVLQIPKNKRV